MTGWRTKDQDYSPDGVVAFAQRRRLELFKGASAAVPVGYYRPRDGRSLAEVYVIEKVGSGSPNGNPFWRWTERKE